MKSPESKQGLLSRYQRPAAAVGGAVLLMGQASAAYSFFHDVVPGSVAWIGDAVRIMQIPDASGALDTASKALTLSGAVILLMVFIEPSLLRLLARFLPRHRDLLLHAADQPVNALKAVDELAVAVPTRTRGAEWTEPTFSGDESIESMAAPTIGGRAVDRNPANRSALDHEPPQSWGAAYWRGKRVLACPSCGYRSIDDSAFQEHGETHTEPPTPQRSREVYREPRPWANVPFHFIGDGTAYVPGVPADPTATLYAASSRVEELVSSGLYDGGPAPAGE